MSDKAPSIVVGQRIRVARTIKPSGSTVSSTRVHEGTIDTILDGSPRAVTFLEDGGYNGGAYAVPVADSKTETVEVSALGWPEDAIAYADVPATEPGEEDERDILVHYRGSGWRELSSPYRSWIDYPFDGREVGLTNIRLVHNGQVPK